MRLSQDLPSPRSREMLASTLTAFAENLVHEVSHPLVIAMFRVAAAEATRSPEIAEALEVSGRETTRRVLADLLARAQKARIIGKGNPSDMAAQFLGLLWEGLQMSLVLGVVAPPKPAKIKRRAAMATAAFLRLHPEPVL
jgi:ribosomal protein L16 Arg81 hydroxylase